ncbi:50S ribosomal protein L24 [Candidatus Roizmanbacteria bacterium]|nr:50S ribosomal protein L24 [Candidatus Roizmanbacteria bacterium]
MKIRKGDKVKILAGKDKGKEGIVEKVYKKQNTALIPNVNIYKKHIKKNEKMPQGGVVELPRALSLSKIAIICPKCGKITRIGYKEEKGKKVRFCKKCKKAIN